MSINLYTDFFEKLRRGIIGEKVTSVETEKVLLKTSIAKNNNFEVTLELLEEVLAPIKTIDDYEMLVSIMESLASQITIRFLAMFFDALVTVEERVWLNSVNKCPPIRKIYEDNSDLLLDSYEEFAYNYEKAIVDWTKQDGMFDDAQGYEFILRRNRIYARYMVVAKMVLEP